VREAEFSSPTAQNPEVTRRGALGDPHESAMPTTLLELGIRADNTSLRRKICTSLHFFVETLRKCLFTAVTPH
jgi:hypothetical protein